MFRVRGDPEVHFLQAAAPGVADTLPSSHCSQALPVELLSPIGSRSTIRVKVGVRSRGSDKVGAKAKGWSYN